MTLYSAPLEKKRGGGEWLLGNQGTRMSWLQHNQSESGKLPRIKVTGIVIYLASNILSQLS